MSDDATLDFMDTDGEVTSQHYAFLATEAEFGEIFACLGERRLPCWSDPRHHDTDINHWDNGREVYFADPNDHSLEVLTRQRGYRSPAPPPPRWRLAMPKLIILYGPRDDPAAFEEYYSERRIPYASEHMPGVTGAENLRVVGTPAGAAAPYYRISQLTYDSLEDLRSGLASDDGQATLADLANFATGGATLLIADG